MYSLPDEQNKLLKEMGELDAQERAGLIPVRSNINLFLIFLVWFFGTVGVIPNITGNSTDGIPLLIGICIGLSFFLILAYYNISFGFYLATIGFLGLSGYMTINSGFQNTPLLILIDSIGIFVFANLFGRNGYIVGSILFVIKAIALFIFFQNDKAIESIIAQVTNMLAIGIIPVLILSISKVSRRAKKQEIRAKILALQSQDLVSSWGSMMGGTVSMPSNPAPASQHSN